MFASTVLFSSKSADKGMQSIKNLPQHQFDLLAANPVKCNYKGMNQRVYCSCLGGKPEENYAVTPVSTAVLTGEDPAFSTPGVRFLKKPGEECENIEDC